MGICMSTATREARKVNADINRKLAKEKSKNRTMVKLLLLGPGDSGKSTVLKQMRICHGKDFTEQEKHYYRAVIIHNMMRGLLMLIQAMDSIGVDFENPTLMDEKGVLEKAEMLGTYTERVTPELHQAFYRLWYDEGVQAAYTQADRFHIPNTLYYFFTDLGRICAEDFKPLQEDILRVRTKTTGIVEVQLNIKGLTFRVLDAGGQRSERKKWISQFEDVKALMYITSLSEYDQTLEEDALSNRMIDSLNLFTTLINNQFFTKTSLIIFFNKTDLFRDKLTKVSLRTTFPEYEGTQDFEESAKFIEDKFLNNNKDPEKRIYVHQTCATDTEQTQVVINTCTDVIISQNIGGLV